MADSTRPAGRYVPAAGWDVLLPLYDPVQRLLGAEALRRALLDQAGLAPGQRVLEIGCGTGDLLIAAKCREPAAALLGLDPDPKALARARRKAQRRGVAVHLDRGFSQALPYPDRSFDRVLSSFMLHHLDAETTAGTLREVRRVLAPGGSLHVVDFGGAPGRPEGRLARLLHHGPATRDPHGSRLPALLGEAGLVDARQTGARRILLLRVAFHAARAPAA
ncbi:MAG: methyltransferase domain-containing protein [Myxococcota bacterium]|nr:methyltransferase domain-containing protein [Myxococcota bacterium]